VAIHTMTLKPGATMFRAVGAVATMCGDVHEKTVDRWQREGVRAGDERVWFPPEDVRLNGYRYWCDATIHAFTEVVQILTRGEELPPHLAQLVERWRQRALEKYHKEESETPPTAVAGGGVFSEGRAGQGRPGSAGPKNS
jgi:hypothetical protein